MSNDGKWMNVELEKAEVLDAKSPGNHQRTSWFRRTALFLCLFSIIASLFVRARLWIQSISPLYTPCVNQNCARKVTGVPSYAIEYAPLVWLDIGEAYFPSDISAQVENTHPNINFSIITKPPTPLTLDNLDDLNSYGRKGRNVYLTSITDVTTSPGWLDGVVPDSRGSTKDAVSCAIITNDHGSENVDVFYMYFYAYNLGNTVIFHELGDHIGDWEHNMIRFKNGKPTAVWYSQHDNGEAFAYKAVEKQGLRPITYAARGSHANYAVPGVHDHTIPDHNLPAGLLLDFTSRGLQWDPTLSAYFYNYDGMTSTFSAADGASPVGAMNYKGRWGDQQYPDGDARQPPPFFGFRKFVSGPTGPWDKQLNRTEVCPYNGRQCVIRDKLGVLDDET